MWSYTCTLTELGVLRRQEGLGCHVLIKDLWMRFERSLKVPSAPTW
jgi:hypothetical protein